MKIKSTSAVICAILGNVIWGFSFLFTKLGLKYCSQIDILLAHRFIITMIIMIVLAIINRKEISFKGKKWGLISVLLVTQIGYFLFESYGIIHTNSTMAGLVLAVVPVVTVGSGAIFLKEYPTKRQALFCILPVIGVILITISGKDLGILTLKGGIFLALALLTSAIYKTANRKVAEEFSGFERTFLVLIATALFFTFNGMHVADWNISTFIAPLSEPKYISVILCLGLLCSVTANLLVNYAMGKMSVFKVASFGALSTLCTALAGIIFLDEPISISIIMGTILILIGVRQVVSSK